MNKIYYIVEGKTSGENSIDAVVNGINYSLVKVSDGDSEPVGSKVSELTREEFLANLTSIEFGGDIKNTFTKVDELKLQERSNERWLGYPNMNQYVLKTKTSKKFLITVNNPNEDCTFEILFKTLAKYSGYPFFHHPTFVLSG